MIRSGVYFDDYEDEKKEPYVLFSRRFINQKGVYDIIKVAKLLPNIKFVMMGWGTDGKALQTI